MNRKDLRQLAAIRLREAKILLDNESYAGAYYLAGYAVECALKACIARQTKLHDFPDKDIVTRSYTHKLTQLVDVAGLQADLDNRIRANRNFGLNWTVVKLWSEEARYRLVVTQQDASGIYTAITDRRDGVLTWLKRYW